MSLASAYSCIYQIRWSWVLSRELMCSWSSAEWSISLLSIVTYTRGLTKIFPDEKRYLFVHQFRIDSYHAEHSQLWRSWKNPNALKRKCLHFDEIFITGCTGSCRNYNFQCSQWLKFRQSDIFVSVWLVNLTIENIKFPQIYFWENGKFYIMPLSIDTSVKYVGRAPFYIILDEKHILSKIPKND